MKGASKTVKSINEYTPYGFELISTYLTFSLDDHKTHVVNKLTLKRIDENKNFVELNGEEVELLSVKVNGTVLTRDEYEYKDEILALPINCNDLVIEIENEVSPIDNKALDGLYKSGSMFCTQNEPEGMRRITFFPDRPDVLSVFTTKIIADKNEYPVLLSNGNLIEKGDLVDGKHFAVWNDPFKKPCYLFALVAGDLDVLEDSFKTKSGRDIKLQIFCDKGNLPKCDFSMASLKNAMKWDEDVYDLEYDLDIYMIVAVDAFNMGAMENKGLNIFNTKAVLANKDTATDADFYKIEGIIGHEYFHNWTGNRVTCREWFQLTLKEGLTVFRDQQFSADMFHKSLQRLQDVRSLRVAQFPEDSGPMKHSIRPSEYIEINNFYTPTVYFKGAEVIRMAYKLLGKDNYYKGIKKYFELYDGKAVTCEDFLKALELASGRNFTQFWRWYEQSGTPLIKVDMDYKRDEKKAVIKLKQELAKDQKAFHMPYDIALYYEVNGEIKEISRLLELKNDSEAFEFTDIETRPYLSLNRDFSAPVNTRYDYSEDELLFLLSYDNDGLNQWNSGLEYFYLLIKKSSEGKNIDEDLAKYSRVLKRLLDDENLHDLFKAKIFEFPSLKEVCNYHNNYNFELLAQIRDKIITFIAKDLENNWKGIYTSSVSSEYVYNAKEAGKRSIKNTALSFLIKLNKDEYWSYAVNQQKNADNMTDELAALHALNSRKNIYKKDANQLFYDKWKNDSLVLLQWFGAQASSKDLDCFNDIMALLEHEAFDIQVPNYVRGLMGPIAANYEQLHHISGRAYQFFKDMIIKTDSINPQVAARIAESFQLYSKLDDVRKELVRSVLEDILSRPGLSKNVFEIVSKTLEA